jgi:hypothetical protein
MTDPIKTTNTIKINDDIRCAVCGRIVCIVNNTGNYGYVCQLSHCYHLECYENNCMKKLPQTTFKVLMYNNGPDDDYKNNKPTYDDSPDSDSSGDEFFYDQQMKDWENKKTKNIVEYPIGIIQDSKKDERINTCKLKDLSRFFKKINPDIKMCNFFIEDIDNTDFEKYYNDLKKEYHKVINKEKFEKEKNEEIEKKKEEKKLLKQKEEIEKKLDLMKNVKNHK